MAGEVNKISSTEVSAGAGLGLADSVVNNLFAGWRQERQNAVNRENWELENEYNLPVNQYHRYIDAGLSPTTAAQAVAGFNSPASIQGSGQPSVSSGSPIADAYFKDQHLMVDKRLADFEADVKAAQAQFYRSSANQMDTLTPKMADKLVAETAKEYSIKDLNVTMREHYSFLTDKAKRIEPLERQKLVADIQSARSLSSLYKEQVNTEQAKQRNLDSDTSMKEASTENIKKEGKNLDYENALNAYKQIYLNYFHADPDSSLDKQFIQASAYGDEEALRVWDAIGAFADAGVNRASQFAKDHPWITAYYGNKLLWRGFTSMANQNNQAFRTLQGFIPFAGGSAVVPSPTAGTYWWEKD